MNERELFEHMEFRICAEFQSHTDGPIRGLWCDGLCPEVYHLAESSPWLRGFAWMGGIPGKGAGHQEQWGFELNLRSRIEDRATFDWSTLLPGEGVTDWLDFDLKEKWIELTLE